jgi:alpha-L-rhamnosidase
MKRFFSILFIVCISLTAYSRSNDWKGQWIQAADCQNKLNTWQCFRKTVNLTSVPSSLKARIAVDSKYWLWINGKLAVFEGGLKRGPLPNGTYYDEIDIAPYLKSGNNTIALLTWFFGKQGFSHKNSYVAALLFDAEGDASILSDNSWEACVYKAYQNTGDPKPNYRLPESNVRFDANLEMADWNQPTFSQHFSKAKVFDKNAINSTYGELVPRPIPFFKDYGLKDYVSTKFDEKTHVLRCKLPYDAQITPYLKVEADAGKVIDIHADAEHYLFSSDTYSVRAEYVTKQGEQSYESLGWMSGEEICYKIPEGVKVLEVKYRETGYDTEIVGDFHCNDDFYNELWTRSARTLYVNMRDNYFDCPDRERALWWGDVTSDLQQNPYVLSLSANKLVLKSIYELINWQRSDNKIFAPVPSGNWAKELPCQMLMSVGWFGFYNYYYYSGDSTFVAPLYDRIHRYLHDTWFFDQNGLIKSRPGEWSWVDAGENKDLDVITNEWYYLALKAEKEFARMLDKKDDVYQDDSLMTTLADAFNKQYWNGKGYKSNSCEKNDDRAQALAVVSCLASKEKYPVLMETIKTTDYAQPLLEYYVIDALYQMGYPEMALERAHKHFEKTISYKDLSTVFEYWTRGNSLNHAWTAFMTVILGKRVCGIEPTSPGFKTFKVEPQLSGLTQASCQLETKYGYIKVNVELKGKKTLVNISVPSGTKATVKIGSKVTNVNEGTHKIVFKS